RTRPRLGRGAFGGATAPRLFLLTLRPAPVGGQAGGGVDGPLQLQAAPGDAVHLVAVQGEVEDSGVTGKLVAVQGRGEHDDRLLLDEPAQGDLGRALAVTLADFLEREVFGGGAAGQRLVGDECYAVLQGGLA